MSMTLRDTRNRWFGKDRIRNAMVKTRCLRGINQTAQLCELLCEILEFPVRSH